MIVNYIKLYQYLNYVSMIISYEYDSYRSYTNFITPAAAWSSLASDHQGVHHFVADHVTEFYGCSGRALRSPLANVPANCRATFLCFVILF